MFLAGRSGGDLGHRYGLSYRERRTCASRSSPAPTWLDLITKEPQPTQAAGRAWRRIHGGDADKLQYGGGIEAAGAAIGEFGEVAGQMPGDGLVIGLVRGVLDLAHDGIESAELLQLHVGRPAAGDRLVLDVSGSNPRECSQGRW